MAKSCLASQLGTSHKTGYSTYYYIGIENKNQVDLKSTRQQTFELYNKLLAKTGGHYVIRINQVYPDEKVNLEEGEPFYDTF